MKTIIETILSYIMTKGVRMETRISEAPTKFPLKNDV